MLRYRTRILILALAAMASCATTQAQTSDGGGARDGTVNTEPTPMLDAEEAFSGVERGDAVGSTSASQTTFGARQGAGANPAGGLGGIGGAFGGGLGGLGGLFNAFGGGQSTAGAERPILRTRIRSAVSVAAIAPETVRQRSVSRLRTSSDPRLRGVDVTMNGRTAIISGSVGSQRDRRMSELLLRLQPGVSRVDNRITVEPPQR